MTTRVQFYCLLMRLDGLKTERYAVMCRLQDELNQRILDEARKLKPKLKSLKGELWPSGNRAMKTGSPSYEAWSKSADMLFKAKGIVTDNLIEERTWPFLERMSWAHKWIDLQIEQVKAELDALAEKLPIEPGEPRYYDEVWTSTYSTQGWGADRYASGAAAMKLSAAHAHGVEGEIRHEKKPLDTFKVFVNVRTALDVEILKRKPPPPYAEQVRECWARGCNPRVINPWLPHGFEEKIGIDYFGKVVDKEKFERACERT